MSAPKSPGEVAAANNFQAFMRGYRHGTRHAAKDIRHIEHPTLREPYEDGYETGSGDAASASRAASGRYGYTPNPLREGSS